MTVPMQFTCTNDSFTSIWMYLLLLPIVIPMRACNSSTNSHVNDNIGISIYHSANAIACKNDSFI